MKHRTMVLPIALIVASCSNSNDSSNPTDGSTLPLNLLESAEGLITSLAVYQADQLAVLVNDMAFEIVSQSAGEPRDPRQFTTEDSRQGVIATSIQRSRHNCSGGGSILRENGIMRVIEPGYSHYRDFDGYYFDQCLHSAANTVLPAGEYLLNGSLVSNERIKLSAEINEGDSYTEWAGFDMMGPDQLHYEVDGAVVIRFSLTDNSDFSGRSVTLSNYAKSVGEKTIDSMSGVDFQLSTIIMEGESQSLLTFEINGQLGGNITKGVATTVNTDPALSLERLVDAASNEQRTFTGQIDVMSEDGGALFLSANADARPGDVFDTLRFAADYTTPSGDTVTNNDFALTTPFENAPNCALFRDVDTGRIACSSEGGAFVIP